LDIIDGQGKHSKTKLN